VLTAGCDATLALLPELATDIAPAQERALALAHASECASCAAALGQAVDTADLLLLVAPVTPVPRALRVALLGPGAPVHRRVPRPGRSRLIAVLSLAAGVVALLVLLAWPLGETSVDRAPSQTAVLRDRQGHDVGNVVLSTGRVPALFLSFRAQGQAVTYEVVTVDVRSVVHRVGTTQATDGVCTFSHALTPSLPSLHLIELLDPLGSAAFSAALTRT
jgi:hypothetical protein